MFDLEFFGIDAAFAILFACFGFAVAGLMFAFYFYRGEKNLSGWFYKVSWYVQTAFQTIAIIALFVLFLGPTGPIYKNFIDYQVNNICIPKYYDFTYYPNGFQNRRDAYDYYGSVGGGFVAVTNATKPINISDIGISRLTCNGTWISRNYTFIACSSLDQAFEGWGYGKNRTGKAN